MNDKMTKSNLMCDKLILKDPYLLQTIVILSSMYGDSYCIKHVVANEIVTQI